MINLCKGEQREFTCEGGDAGNEEETSLIAGMMSVAPEEKGKEVEEGGKGRNEEEEEEIGTE